MRDKKGEKQGRREIKETRHREKEIQISKRKTSEIDSEKERDR